LLLKKDRKREKAEGQRKGRRGTYTRSSGGLLRDSGSATETRDSGVEVGVGVEEIRCVRVVKVGRTAGWIRGEG
jgi:hypothetical protein